MRPRPRVVIVGGGFGGLAAAKELRDAPVEVVLIDRENHHLFQPLLYQVATGALSPANIAVPLRRILSKQRNTRVLLGEVTDVDLHAREVALGARRVRYDWLIVATGARSHWFGHDEWERVAPGLKSIIDATTIRARILCAFETAELEPDRAGDWLTFAVIGGGPTGVEMAGAIAELARDTLRLDFRAVDTATARIVLVEGADRILATYPDSLVRKARRALERRGIEVWTNALVTAVGPDGPTVKRGDEEVHLDARTVIWAAGVQATSLASRIAERAGIEVDRGGRIPVDARLSVSGHPEVMVIGDTAAVEQPDGTLLPGVAPVAMQEGQYAASAILERVRGATPPPFRYRDRGSMATIGRGQAVFHRGPIRVAGFLGWLGWLFIHLMQLAEFENRLLVVTQWAWSYLTRNRAARLIINRRERP